MEERHIYLVLFVDDVIIIETDEQFERRPVNRSNGYPQSLIQSKCFCWIQQQKGSRYRLFQPGQSSLKILQTITSSAEEIKSSRRQFQIH